MRVAEEFQARHQHSPAVVAAAPGRVNLIGEHLDYNGGLALPIALPVRTTVALGRRTDGLLVVESLQSEHRVEVSVSDLDDAREGWAAYVLGVVWALRAAGDGLTVLVDGQVPLGAGLSSSAALECAVGTALVGAGLVEASKERIVEACVSAENDFVGAPTGSMDQTVSIFAEAGHALLVDFSTGARRQVPWTPPGDLLVVDTRAAHELVDGAYAERRRSCEEAAAALGLAHLAEARPEQVEALEEETVRRRARHVVAETARVRSLVEAIESIESIEAIEDVEAVGSVPAAGAGDAADGWRRVGNLMTESHASLRDDYEVSCDELDVAVAAALAAGAWGARMTGGGFGGSAIALCAPGDADLVRQSVSAAFAERGFAEPGFVDGTASAAAEVLSS